MSKLGIAILFVVLLMHGTALGQSLLDSIFGPSGLGVLGAPQAGAQFDDPRYYRGSVNADPSRQMAQPSQPGYPEGYSQGPQQAYGYGQQPYAPGQQYYPQDPNQPPAPVPPPQYGPAPQLPPQGASQVQRSLPRATSQSQGQRSAHQRVIAAPPQETGGRFGDPLPPGAVRVTTTTPEGTIVQYYPPTGTPEGEQAYRQRPRPSAASSRPPRVEQQKAHEQPEAVRSSIAMPKPVPIPQNQDPRIGWTPNP